ncbi:MAG: hypothetical protein FWH14_06485 [Oscillospiraceae bacterium]|nr:hypothetical protein [Oscillospiraceae bacterium]
MITPECYFTLGTGQRVDCNRIVSLNFKATLYTPCDSLTLSIPPQTFLSPANYLYCAITDRIIFDGIIDRQTSVRDETGINLITESRSRSSLMVDSQAMPAQYGIMAPNNLFMQYAQNYGVSGHDLRLVAVPLYAVGTGKSHWDVIKDFCRSAYDAKPALTASRVLTVTPVKGTDTPKIIRNTGAGIKYTSLRFANSRYNMISDFYVTDLEDTSSDYTINLNNSESAKYGFTRRRYFQNSYNWNALRGTASIGKLYDTNQDQYCFTAELPGLHDIYPGDRSVLTDNMNGGMELYVYETEISVNNRGAFTRLKLYDQNQL